MLNLWELMVHCQNDPIKGERIKQMLTELESKHVQSGQEISIGTSQFGWLIKIESCHSDMEVVILVPEDARNPVQVLKDTRADAKSYSAYYEDE